MKVWLFVLVFGFFVGIWSGWELRGKFENNPIAAAKSWIFQTFNRQSKPQNCQ